MTSCTYLWYLREVAFGLSRHAWQRARQLLIIKTLLTENIQGCSLRLLWTHDRGASQLFGLEHALIQVVGTRSLKTKTTMRLLSLKTRRAPAGSWQGPLAMLGLLALSPMFMFDMLNGGSSVKTASPRAELFVSTDIASSQAKWSYETAVLRYRTLSQLMVPDGKLDEEAPRCFRSVYSEVHSVESAAALTEILRSNVAFHAPASSLFDESEGKHKRCNLLKNIDLIDRPSDCTLGQLCVPSASAIELATNDPPLSAKAAGGDVIMPDSELTIKVINEVGNEIIGFVPWGYHTTLQHHLNVSISVADSRPFWFFSRRHCEAAERIQRRWVGFGDTMDTPWPHRGKYIKLANVIVEREVWNSTGVMPRWRMPPFAAHYCGWGLTPFSGRRYIVIYNKRYGYDAVFPNFINATTLVRLFDMLSPHYVIVYHRTISGFFGSERSGYSESMEDFEALTTRAEELYGPTATVDGEPGQRLVLMTRFMLRMRQEALKQGDNHADADGDSVSGSEQPGTFFSMNELQLSILADADGYISVLGGPAYLNLLWGPGRPVVLLEEDGTEVSVNSRVWYDLLSGANATSVRDNEALVGAVAAAFLDVAQERPP